MGSSLSSISQSDSPSGPAASQLNADWTLGPLFIGWSLNIFLCGLVVSWAGRYLSRTQTKDRLWVKLLIAIAVLAEVATAALNMTSIFRHGRDRDRSNAAISLLESADALSLTTGAICAFCAQFFFGFRCFRVLPSRRYRYPFAFVCGGLMLAALGGSLGITIVELINRGRTDETRGARPGTYELLYLLAQIWLWCSVAVDGLISVLLIVRLAANRTEIQKRASQTDQASGTSVLLSDFMRLAFECAILTMLCATTGAITYVLTTETTNLSYTFTNMLPGLYTLSLLWAVNSTHRLRQEVDQIDPSTLVQLVWNLASDEDDQPGRERRLSELARGEGLAVSLKKSSAPRKAVKQLGHEVNLLTVDRLNPCGGMIGCDGSGGVPSMIREEDDDDYDEPVSPTTGPVRNTRLKDVVDDMGDEEKRIGGI